MPSQLVKLLNRAWRVAIGTHILKQFNFQFSIEYNCVDVDVAHNCEYLRLIINRVEKFSVIERPFGSHRGHNHSSFVGVLRS